MSKIFVVLLTIIDETKKAMSVNREVALSNVVDLLILERCRRSV
jgi:hypothetical protein